MIKPIYLYNSTILKQSMPEVDFMSTELTKGLEDAFDTIEATRAVGLSANQIGVRSSFFLINAGGGIGAFINPLIIEYSKDTSEEEEGCLSLPGLLIPAVRSNTIWVEYRDHNLTKHETKFTGIVARVFQHEFDHLCGRYMFQKPHKFLPKKERKAINMYLKLVSKDQFDVLNKLGIQKPNYQYIIKGE